jgi:hypothetical protein
MVFGGMIWPARLALPRKVIKMNAKRVLIFSPFSNPNAASRDATKRARLSLPGKFGL